MEVEESLFGGRGSWRRRGGRECDVVLQSGEVLKMVKYSCTCAMKDCGSTTLVVYRALDIIVPSVIPTIFPQESRVPKSGGCSHEKTEVKEACSCMIEDKEIWL